MSSWKQTLYPYTVYNTEPPPPDVGVHYFLATRRWCTRRCRNTVAETRNSAQFPPYSFSTFCNFNRINENTVDRTITDPFSRYLRTEEGESDDDKMWTPNGPPPPPSGGGWKFLAQRIPFSNPLAFISRSYPKKKECTRTVCLPPPPPHPSVFLP